MDNRTQRSLIASAQKAVSKIPADECEKLAVSWDYDDDPRDDYMPESRRFGRTEEDRVWRRAFREAITVRADFHGPNRIPY